MLTHTVSEKTQYYLQLEDQYGAHNYHPIPVVLEKGVSVQRSASAPIACMRADRWACESFAPTST